jgi:hypothetical protein
MKNARPPGYEARQRIRQQLPLLPARARAALLANCAERVLPVLQNYWGRLAPFDKAIELTWAFALDHPVQDEDIASAVAACDKSTQELYDDDETGATLRAANAVYWAVKSIQDPQPLAWEQSMSEAQGAADIDDPKRGDTFIAEEAEWQIKALDIVASAKVPFREMFDSIKSEPEWLRVYRQEKWIQR